VLPDLAADSGSFWREAAIDFLHAFTDGMIGVECRHTEFNSYITNLGPTIKTFRHYEFPSRYYLTPLYGTQYEKQYYKLCQTFRQYEFPSLGTT